MSDDTNTPARIDRLIFGEDRGMAAAAVELAEGRRRMP